MLGIRLRTSVTLAVACVLTVVAVGALAAETPKRGGILTFVVAGGAPSFDAHREWTFAMLQRIAPFYSVLIRVNPENPSSTTDFVCDLCITVPKPTDGGEKYTFKILKHVKFHDGSPLTARDVVASYNKIVFPPKGVISSRKAFFSMVKGIHALGFGVGIALGYATLGQIGFEGRFQYAAIGSTLNLASRLCDQADNGQILVTQRVCAEIKDIAESEPVGELTLEGFLKPVPAFNVTGLKAGESRSVESKGKAAGTAK